MTNTSHRYAGTTAEHRRRFIETHGRAAWWANRASLALGQLSADLAFRNHWSGRKPIRFRP